MIETVSQEELCAEIKRRVTAISPDAEIRLYGSRARGDARPDSDWDLLILTGNSLSEDDLEEIQSELYELELDTGEVLVPIFHPHSIWNSPLYQAMPFHQSVTREGVVL